MSETVDWIGTVVCPCTTFEQDESCPEGYPSLLCGACGGKGVVRAETVQSLAAEMMKVAEQVGKLEDPFAAWVSIDHFKSRARREALEEAALWHDSKVQDYTDQIAVNNAYLARGGLLSSESRANEYCDDMRSCHRRSAAAIRALIPSEPHDAEGRE